MSASARIPDQRLADRRSLAYHDVIARRLAGDPTLLARARARVAQWLRSGHVASYYAESWRDILARPDSEIQRLLCEDGEYMTALRQVSPFAGGLPPRERWRIWRSVGTAS